MQVNVIEGGRDAFNSMLYNVPDQSTLAWLDNNISRGREALVGIADNLVAATEQLYNKVNSSGIINAAKALVTQQGTHTNEYMIYGLDDGNMHNANYVMQQYIMANPQVQNMVQDNMCVGYEETYYNTEPSSVGVDRLDYQRVMDGVIQEEESGLYINHYSNDDVVELPTYDQHIILDTWQHVENMILCGYDPTDPNV